MATVTGYTAARMKQIEDSAVVDGDVIGSNLILTQRNGVTINAGSVIGPQGIQGPPGPTSIVVCTSTTRPIGGSLFTGLAIYETDTKKFYIYDGGAWIYRGGTFICTSTSRPTPFIGLEIYETDTKKSLVWNGVRWDPPWNSAWGLLGYIQRITDAGPITSASEATIGNMSVALTMVSNRRIKITFESNTFSQSGTDNITYARIMEDATELMVGNSWNTYGGYATSLHTEVTRTPTAASHTYSIKVGMLGSGQIMIMGRTNAPMSLSIEDIGPNGVPV